MKYWYIFSHHNKTGEPIWKKGTAYGYRRKNGHDQVFVRTISGKEWIFAVIAKD
jgi:hypothetical protein